MKKSEREALKKAFNIPEPQNKDSFAAKYEHLIKKNERRLRFPVYTKYAATAVFAALVIGVWGRMTVSRDYVDKYRNGNLTSDTAVVTTAEDTQTSTESVGEDNNSAVTEVSVQTAETGSAVQTQTVTTAFSKIEASENTENNGEEEHNNEEPNEEEPQETPVQTAAVNTSVNVVTAVTTAEANTPPPPTTASEPVNHGQTTSRHDVFPKPIETTTPTEYNPPPIAPQTTSRHDDAPEPVETTTHIEYDPSPPPPAMDDVDRRPWVIPSVKYEKSDNYININDLENSCSSPNVDFHPSTDNDTVLGINELFERSKYIIKAEVIEKFYTAVDFHPYTQYDLLTMNCYKHDGKYPAMPSVYVPGGYMPAEVYCEGAKIENVFPDGSVVYSDGGNKGETELYREYIFFIDDGLQSMPDGSYRLTAATDISIFAYDGEKYVSLGNPSLTFTEEELTYLT